MPTVSVVIPTYQRRERLEPVIAPLLDQPGLHEILIVVDGSTDGTAELAAELARKHPAIRFISIGNRGTLRARLAGAFAATGEVVLAIDDDVHAEPGLVLGHARHHARGARLVQVGYMPIEVALRRRGDHARDLYAREYERTVSEWERDPDTILSTLWGGNFSIRRGDYIELASDLEQAVTGYHEDRDFGLYCREHGLIGAFDRSLRARHCFERSYEAFMRDARSSARSLPSIAKRHPEAPPLPDGFPLHDLPVAARVIARAAARSRLLRFAVRVGTVLAGRARLFTLERWGLGLEWSVEELRVLAEDRR